MRQTSSIDEFTSDPVGKWIAAGVGIFWCARPDLCGSVAWGRSSEGDARATVSFFALYTKLAPRFDVILDARRVAGIDPIALATLLAWLAKERDQLVARVRLQIGVIEDSLIGLTLSGILPVLGETHRFRVVRKPEEAFLALSPDDGSALCAEVEAAVASVVGEPKELRELRSKLREHQGRLTLEQAARELSVSTRTLQRMLSSLATTYQDELRTARFAVAETLLTGSDEKIASIAARVGVTEGVLTRIVREETGLTPGDLRKRRRASDA